MILLSGGGIRLEIILHELLHSVAESFQIILWIFLTYLLVEWLEHNASERIINFLVKGKATGPFWGALVGLTPQCGLTSMSASLYSGHVITMGTLIAVFLANIGDSLPLLIAHGVRLDAILGICITCFLAAVITGFIVDLVRKHICVHRISELCVEANCHCGDKHGILLSAVKHTLILGNFVVIVNVIITLLFTFVDEALIARALAIPVLSQFTAAIFGLLPTCIPSITLTSFAIEGLISWGTLVSGLLSGAGIGVWVLFKTNKHKKENLLILALLVIIGTITGIFIDIILRVY